MENRTNEFSFAIKPTEHGVGVFATHAIKEGAYLRLFGEEDKTSDVSVIRNKKDVPEFFRSYCVDRGDLVRCPKDFGCMEIGWHVNHSSAPNAEHKKYEFYALRDIAVGEEITIDYNTLEEPEEAKEDFYMRQP